MTARSLPALRGRNVCSRGCKRGRGAVITDVSSADKMNSELWLSGNYVTRAASFSTRHTSMGGMKADVFDNILTHTLREGEVR